MAQVLFAVLSLLAAPRAVDAKSTSEVHTVTIVGMKFSPERVEAHVGDTIVWKNDDIVPHTATSENKSFDSGAINQEKSWRYVLRRKGLFPYSCVFHPTMKAVLVVK